MKPLTIFKASAGSGKTFTLTTEYIKLLIKDPLCFKSTIAVTFTNKATEEMKTRIISQLYGIWKLLPDSASYIDEITSALNIDKGIASKQAGLALSYLMHNYNYFRVQTIDAFFQTVLRNLARELNLTANMRIALNDSQIENLAVDTLIDSLNEKSIILQWLMSYINATIDDGKGWNIIGSIKNFGLTIFKDFYKSESNNLQQTFNNKNFFSKYTKMLKETKQLATNKMTHYADEFKSVTQQAGLTPASYSGGKNGIASYFRKLKTTDFSDKNCIKSALTKCLDTPDAWAAKSSKEREVILSVVNDKLFKLLHDAEEERKVLWVLYNTATVTLRHLDKLRLLNSIEEEVNLINNDNNCFLLSNTQFLLNQLIKDSDSPFVFEKIGCQLEHIMIDEFQDTGLIQWRNFKVLLKECMSQNKDTDVINNLIVGDVKQSIYRWRSGDWQLLNNISDEFETPEKSLEIKTLQTNYRSERRIINFNNAFFKIAANLEYEHEKEINSNGAIQIQKAYSDVYQTVPDNKPNTGYVNIKLLGQENDDEHMMQELVCCVDKLHDNGAEYNSIAILLRKNEKFSVIADYFAKHRPEIKLVSDEAFRLEASLSVNIIIQALRLLVDPANILIRASLAVSYTKKIMHNDAISFSNILTNGADENHLNQYLPKLFVENMSKLTLLPLFEIVEKIYKFFQLENIDNQEAYICAFYDGLSDFIKTKMDNIEGFINEWDDSLHSQAIQAAEIDGIRMISIHKSKGLEFDNVIIPYCNWTLERYRDNLIWCKPTLSPFNQLPLVPIDYNKQLSETIYAKDYEEEHLQNTVDNLNLLYVAFTRASKNLMIIGTKCDKNGKAASKTRSAIIIESLDKLTQMLDGATLTGHEDLQSPTSFEYGQIYIKEKKDKKPSQNVFLQPVYPKTIHIGTFDLLVNFKQSNKSKEFIAKNDCEDEHKSYIKMGNILHNLFSRIRTTADIQNVIKELEFEGILYDEDITAAKMKETLTKRLSNPKVADWFNDQWQVFNECSILFINEKTGELMERRPDRVIYNGKEMKVIDFKFGKSKEEHKAQVMQYIQLLKSMGYPHVMGYLWYVYTNTIVPV